jgi:hypothetical protein
MITAIKVCSICQTDLDGKKRIKDTEGSYFCPRCWEARLSLAGVAEPTPPAVVDVGRSTAPSQPSSTQPPASPPARQPASVQSLSRDVPPSLWRKAVWPPLGMGAALLVLGWAGYIASAVFHYDIFATGDHTVRDDHAGILHNQIYLGMALFFTLLGTAGAALVARSRLYTVKHGRRVTGRIAGLASFGYKGVRKVIVEYEVDGRSYEYQSSEGNVPVYLKMGLGDEVIVYAHPRKPSRAVVLRQAPSEAA